VLEPGPAHWRDLFPAPGEEPAASPRSGGTASLARAAGAPEGADLADRSADSLFAPDGPLSKACAALGRPFQPRAGQARLAGLAERAFEEGRLLAVESDPGTGRTLACLAAAARHALARRGPVLFAAGSRARADRIASTEFPLLASLFGPELRLAALKAPSAYLSPRKYEAVLRDPAARLTDAERLAVLPLVAWREETSTGDAGENKGFNHERQKVLWSKLCADSYASEPGSFAHAARERAARAHVTVVSHGLAMDDLALDFALLPPAENVLFDDAHLLPEAAQEGLGREIGFFRLRHALQLLAASKSDDRGLIAALRKAAGIEEAPTLPLAAEEALSGGAPADDPEAVLPADGSGAGAGAGAPPGGSEDPGAPIGPPPSPSFAEAVIRLRRTAYEPEKQLQKFFTRLGKHAQKRRKDGENRIRYADKLAAEFNASPEGVVASLHSLESLLGAIAEALEAQEGADAGAKDLAPDVRRAASLLRGYRADLEHLADGGRPGEVFWIEEFANPHKALIRCAPKDAGAVLSDRLHGQLAGAVFASSSIALGDQLGFFCRRIGLEPAHLDRVRTAAVRGQGAAGRLPPLLLCRFTPVLAGGKPMDAMMDVLAKALRRLGRPAFVLFTHIGLLKQARARLGEELGKDGRLAAAQHVDGSRDGLLHLFRHRKDAVLLGTDAFVDGLGPGDTLPEVAAVTKLPFPVPSEPLAAAALEKVQEEGGNALYDYLLPSAILRLKQDLGRLPRLPHGRAAVWILDPRLCTEKYARAYLRGLGRESAVAADEEALHALTLDVLEGRPLPAAEKEKTEGAEEGAARTREPGAPREGRRHGGRPGGGRQGGRGPRGRPA
jgi:DNA polymerase-3 subunit epsilon/ATP-dependent DNA helicase DinG